jgi:hypothetical protein
MPTPAGSPTTAPLTEAEVAWLRSELGTTGFDVVELQARYARLGDVFSVAREVTRERLANLVNGGPADFTIPGVISTGSAANIKALTEQLNRLAEPGVDDGGAGEVLTVVRPVPRRARR